MTANGIICPVCGSTNFERKHETKGISYPYGIEMPYLHASCECFGCDAGGDFYLENDDRIETAERQSMTYAVDVMLEKLQTLGFRPSYIERVLRLKQGTLKNAPRSREMAALLRILLVRSDVLAELDT